MSEVVQSKRVLFRKYFNRSLPFINCQFWDLGERVELPKICDGENFYEPLFLSTPERGVGVYYNEDDPRQNAAVIVYYFNIRQKEFFTVIEKYEQLFKDIEQEARNDTKDPRLLFAMLAQAWPALVLAGNISFEARDVALPEIIQPVDRLREHTDKIVYEASTALLVALEKLLPEEYAHYTRHLLFEEFFNPPCIATLQERKNHSIIFRGVVSSDALPFFLHTHGLVMDHRLYGVEVTDKNVLSGTVAWKGLVQGPACVLFNSSESKRMQQGEILVVSMSTPDFMSAIRKASAIVTDEGGITSHAAIVARELKKPCIVGTKIATQVIKNADLVEVDADKGVIKILERAK